MRAHVFAILSIFALAAVCVSCPAPTAPAAAAATAAPAPKFVLGVSSADVDLGTVAKTPDAAGYEAGSKVSLSATPALGYRFAGWSGSATSGDNPYAVTVDRDMSFVAAFELDPNAPHHRIDFAVNPAGAGTVNKQSADYAEGTKLSGIAATANRGYRFSHWQIGALSDSHAGIDYQVKTADESITAYFDAIAPVTPNVAISPAGAASYELDPAAGPYYPGDVVKVTVKPAANYVFSAWSGDLSGTQANACSWTLDTDPSATATLTKLKLLTVSATGANPALTLSPAGGAYQAGATVALTAPELTGYVFDGWKENGVWYGDPQQNTVTVQMNADRNLVAQYTPNATTVLVYMDGDNNLEANAIQDFNEMEAADLRGTGINVVVLFDRAPGYDATNSNWTGTRAYQVKYGGSTTPDIAITSPRVACPALGVGLASEIELNMGDPNTLTKFAAWGKSAYPAPQNVLVFWNHGSGWRQAALGSRTPLNAAGTAVSGRGFAGSSGSAIQFTSPKSGNASASSNARALCADDTNSGILFTRMLGSALSDNSFDVIGFDLCFAGMIEVAYEIRNKAAYMIASEEITQGDGWEYHRWLADFAAKANRTNLELVNSVVDNYKSTYFYTNGMTLAGYDLSKIDDLMSALNAFSSALTSYITDSARQTNVALMFYNTVEDFNVVPGDWNIDIWHMADRVYNAGYLGTPATALKSALSAAVVKEWHNTAAGNPNAHGMAIHFSCLDDTGRPKPGAEDPAYFANHYTISGGMELYAPSFVDAPGNTWVPNCTNATVGSGLIYQIWYHYLP